MEPKDITDEQHIEFYRYIANSFDTPRFKIHFKTDVPVIIATHSAMSFHSTTSNNSQVSIRAVLYFPEGKPGLFDMSRESETGVALYTRKILIQSKTELMLPKWLRFVKGVVDSEDIPLNLSRELLQNSSLIRYVASYIHCSCVTSKRQCFCLF